MTVAVSHDSEMDAKSDRVRGDLVDAERCASEVIVCLEKAQSNPLSDDPLGPYSEILQEFATSTAREKRLLEIISKLERAWSEERRRCTDLLEENNAIIAAHRRDVSELESMLERGIVENPRVSELEKLLDDVNAEKARAWADIYAEKARVSELEAKLEHVNAENVRAWAEVGALNSLLEMQTEACSRNPRHGCAEDKTMSERIAAPLPDPAADQSLAAAPPTASMPSDVSSSPATRGCHASGVPASQAIESPVVPGDATSTAVSVACPRKREAPAPRPRALAGGMLPLLRPRSESPRVVSRICESTASNLELFRQGESDAEYAPASVGPAVTTANAFSVPESEGETIDRDKVYLKGIPDTVELHAGVHASYVAASQDALAAPAEPEVEPEEHNRQAGRAAEPQVPAEQEHNEQQNVEMSCKADARHKVCAQDVQAAQKRRGSSPPKISPKMSPITSPRRLLDPRERNISPKRLLDPKERHTSPRRLSDPKERNTSPKRLVAAPKKDAASISDGKSHVLSGTSVAPVGLGTDTRARKSFIARGSEGVLSKPSMEVRVPGGADCSSSATTGRKTAIVRTTSPVTSRQGIVVRKGVREAFRRF